MMPCRRALTQQRFDEDRIRTAQFPRATMTSSPSSPPRAGATFPPPLPEPEGARPVLRWALGGHRLRGVLVGITGTLCLMTPYHSQYWTHLLTLNGASGTSRPSKPPGSTSTGTT